MENQLSGTKILVTCIMITLVILSGIALVASMEYTRNLIVCAIPYVVGIGLICCGIGMFGLGIMYLRWLHDELG
jgi:hypothetical protein